MRFDSEEQSRNIEDRRGAGWRGGGGRGRRAGGIGIGTIVIALVAMYFGIDPAIVLNNAGVGAPVPRQSVPAGPRPAEEDALARFVSMVLADTEKTWHTLFQAGGRSYVEPKLVLFTGATQTACGVGQDAMGPFYCPADQKVYIDLGFYDDLRQRYSAPGDFAQAYVIAHEIGHHVQNLLGISAKVQSMRQRVSEREGNQLSVRLELQADCLAGIWAHHADRARNVLEAGDIEEALAAATAIGDDRLQKQARGYAVPDSFTHGSSAQRVRWFRTGFESGAFGDCDTFSTERL
ncbi:MAG: neutral zinc metallopeptidase [Rhodocyclaceae bacterium]|nr:neutral zinc metallopeptidase [Rhodocyclaceae bacterium]